MITVGAMLFNAVAKNSKHGISMIIAVLNYMYNVKQSQGDIISYIQHAENDCIFRGTSKAKCLIMTFLSVHLSVCWYQTI